MFCCPSHGTECEVRRTPGPSLARRRRWTSFRSSLPSRASPYCTRRRQRCVATKPDYVGQIRAAAEQSLMKVLLSKIEIPEVLPRVCASDERFQYIAVLK